MPGEEGGGDGCQYFHSPTITVSMVLTSGCCWMTGTGLRWHPDDVNRLGGISCSEKKEIKLKLIIKRPNYPACQPRKKAAEIGSRAAKQKKQMEMRRWRRDEERKKK